eukprot:scaffold14923_cov149-Skeletonema_dohrnii-CCMP3373.AAC.4
MAFFLRFPSGFTYDVRDASEDSLAIYIPEANQADQQQARANMWMATRSCWHFNRCKSPPTSTKPSSQTEKMCVETEFGSYKALVVV